MSIKQIKVGVDARLLSRPLTGIGRYTFEMCRALSNIEKVSLYLYSPTAIQFAKAEIRTRNWNHVLLRQLWLEIDLPWQAKQDGIDIFWGPAHRLPQWLPKQVVRIVTIHDLVWKYASETMRFAHRWLERYQFPSSIKHADWIIASSQATAVNIRETIAIDGKRLSVIPLGASLTEERISSSCVSSMEIDRPFVLFVGTLEPRKNLLRLLNAYAGLPESLKNKHLLVIAGGRGWGKLNLRESIVRLGLENHVRYLGFVEDATLAWLYKNAKFLVMPSLYEGFGLPLIEAMAQGTPVLTANGSSMPEVAGDAGLFVDPLNVDSIRKGIEKMLTDDEFRHTLALRAKRNATKYNWDTSAKKLVKIFEEAIALHKGFKL